MRPTDKKPKPYRYKAIGILNRDGDLWTPQWFESENQARAYVEQYWATRPAYVSGYSYVPVRVTVSVVTPHARRARRGAGR